MLFRSKKTNATTLDATEAPAPRLAIEEPLANNVASNESTDVHEEMKSDAPQGMLHPGVAVRSQVACEFCGKLMSAKTLKYNHKFSCKSKPIQQPEAESVKQSEVNTINQVADFITDGIVKEAYRQRLYNEREARAKLKAERMQRLIAQAFYFFS